MGTVCLFCATDGWIERQVTGVWRQTSAFNLIYIKTEAPVNVLRMLETKAFHVTLPYSTSRSNWWLVSFKFNIIFNRDKV